jgi:D-alanyl-D-alanine dipeptidase
MRCAIAAGARGPCAASPLAREVIVPYQAGRADALHPSCASLARMALLVVLLCGGCAPGNRQGTASGGGAQGTPQASTTDGERDPGAPPSAGDPVAIPLVDVVELDSTFVLDVRYATPDNFTGKTLYPVARCLLRPDVAARLLRVHARLHAAGLGLKLYDCYRPLSIQRELWARVPDERYVANPAKGSRHNRGAAVDLTLVDSGGRELPMPTEYDNFTPQAHRDYGGGTAEQRANRERLENAMLQEGFLPLPTEWWHFDDPRWKDYAILDVPLSSPNADHTP